MKEILLIKTDNSEKIKSLLNAGGVNYSIVYNDILTSENFSEEKKLSEAYEEWANDPNEWRDIKAKY